MNTETPKLSPIAVLNDKARTTFIGCRLVATAALDAMCAEKVEAILNLVKSYDAFDDAGMEDGNDPYGEHDFGAFNFEGTTFFWKFAYYADERYSAGAENPASPSTARILTIMLASDY